MHCFLQDKVWKGLCAYSSPPCGNGSNTHFCRETGYVANTRFFRSFLLRFDSDKWDLTQTWLRYLDQKTAVGASVFIWHAPKTSIFNLHIQGNSKMSILVCRTQARTPSSVLETLLRQLNLILIMPTFIITEARFLSSVCLVCMTLNLSSCVSSTHYLN